MNKYGEFPFAFDFEGTQGYLSDTFSDFSEFDEPIEVENSVDIVELVDIGCNAGFSSGSESSVIMPKQMGTNFKIPKNSEAQQKISKLPRPNFNQGISTKLLFSSSFVNDYSLNSGEKSQIRVTVKSFDSSDCEEFSGKRVDRAVDKDSLSNISKQSNISEYPSEIELKSNKINDIFPINKETKLKKNNTNRNSGEKLEAFQQGKSGKQKIPMKKSKLPVRISNRSKPSRYTLQSNEGQNMNQMSTGKDLPIKIEDKVVSPELKKSQAIKESMPVKNYETSVKANFKSSHENNYEKAYKKGTEIGQQILNMIKLVKKNQNQVEYREENDDTSISIVKQYLKQTLTNEKSLINPEEVYPQFYIGSTPSELKLFRVGNEWMSL